MNLYLSVIMSIYNEKIEYIMQAVQSVLEQTLSEFEFIIVNDNPDRKELDIFLNDLKRKDKRIIILKNSENIGLAKSMNKAAMVARTPFLARMDADDICEKERFVKEYEAIIKGNYDLVYSWVSTINQDGSFIRRSGSPYPTELTKNLTPFNIYIHHPTVIIKKSVFEKLGGYRDFPYAQDRDLWLRMLSNNCTFFVVSENLLRYRVHSNATSSAKLAAQSLCALYATDLYIERNRYNSDSYSKEACLNFISKHYKEISYDFDNVQKFSQIQINARTLSQNGSTIKALLLRLKVMMFSRYHRRRSIFLRVKLPFAYLKRRILYTLFCNPEKVKIHYE